MHALTRLKLKKYFWINIPYIITGVFWVWAKIELSEEMNFSELPRYISQLMALIGIVMLAQNYLLSTRIRVLENFYGGLDKLYSTHNIIGRVAFILIIAHPLLLIIQNITDLEVVATLIIPFLPSGSIPKTFGILSLYVYTILILITIFKFLPYHIWKITHSLLGIPFIFGAIHGLGAESDVKYFTPMKFWIGAWIIIGLYSYFYKLLLYRYWGPKYKYVVDKVQHFGDVHELYLRPKEKRINFEPGEFVFISFRNNEWIRSEHHPFTISSSPSKDYLRISYKELGDYTSQLEHAKPEDRVDIFGPYGEFSSYTYAQYKKQVWIAGGIGVTPFLSMLEYEAHNSDKKNIQFYYTGRKEEDLTYDKEIKDIMKESDDNIKYETVLSSKHGRLSGKKIMDDVGDLSEYLVLICGPIPMMRSLKKQLISHGVSKDLIVFEEFNFR